MNGTNGLNGGERETKEAYGVTGELQGDCTSEETVFYPLSPVFLTLYNTLLQEAG